MDLRTMRIFRGLDLRVVLAMDGGPLLGHHAGRHPQPEAKEVRHDRVQVQCAVRLAAVQIDGDRRDRDVRQRESRNYIPPPREVQPAGKHQFELP